jgi:hypothetical protein
LFNAIDDRESSIYRFDEDIDSLVELLMKPNQIGFLIRQVVARLSDRDRRKRKRYDSEKS